MVAFLILTVLLIALGGFNSMITGRKSYLLDIVFVVVWSLYVFSGVEDTFILYVVVALTVGESAKIFMKSEMYFCEALFVIMLILHTILAYFIVLNVIS